MRSREHNSTSSKSHAFECYIYVIYSSENWLHPTLCASRWHRCPKAEGEKTKRTRETKKMCVTTRFMQVDANGDLLTVTWSPMFEGVLTCASRDVAPYYEAYRAFQSLIEEGSYAEDHTVRLRLRPGQCLVFNNRRLLHGREVRRKKTTICSTMVGVYGVVYLLYIFIYRRCSCLLYSKLFSSDSCPRR